MMLRHDALFVVVLLGTMMMATGQYPDCQRLYGPASALDCMAQCCGGNSTRRCWRMSPCRYCTDPAGSTWKHGVDCRGQCFGPHIWGTIYNHTLDMCEKTFCTHTEDLPIRGCSRDPMFWSSLSKIPSLPRWCTLSGRRQMETEARQRVIDHLVEYDREYRKCRAHMGVPLDISTKEAITTMADILLWGTEPPCGRLPYLYGGSNPTPIPHIRIHVDSRTGWVTSQRFVGSRPYEDFFVIGWFYFLCDTAREVAVIVMCFTMFGLVHWKEVLWIGAIGGMGTLFL